MEKPAAAKSKNKILRFLPKAAQAAVSLSFQNPPFSPGRDRRPDINSHKLRTHLISSKGFSGPIVPMIPAEARRESKNFETTQEPTSPKVSCMGQIKHKNRIISKKKLASLPKEFKPVSYSQSYETSKSRPTRPAPELKKKPSGIKKNFGAGRKADKAYVDHGKPTIPDRAPSLSQMRRFASGRETLTNFDWTTAQIAPEDQDCGFCSEEDRGYSDGEDDVIIPFSAPILVAGARAGGGLPLEPRKEINLWKRRTMAQPKPLQLSIVGAQ